VCVFWGASRIWYITVAFSVVFCVYNFQLLFMLLSFNLHMHVRLICAITHLLTYLLTKQTHIYTKPRLKAFYVLLNVQI